MSFSIIIDFKLAYATPTSIYTLEYTTGEPVKSLLFSSDEDIQAFDMDWKRGLVIWANGTGYVKASLFSGGQSNDIPTSKPGMYFGCRFSVVKSCFFPDLTEILSLFMITPQHALLKLTRRLETCTGCPVMNWLLESLTLSCLIRVSPSSCTRPEKRSMTYLWIGSGASCTG